MGVNTTKRRKKQRVRLHARKRRNWLGNIAFLSLLVVGLAAIACVPVVNRSVSKQSGAWYVAGQQMEIAAPPVNTSALTLTDGNVQAHYTTAEGPAGGSAGSVLPELTLLPSRHSVQPEETIPPMDILEPEATLEPQPETITITAVGDCTLGGNVSSGGDDKFDAYVEHYGYDYFFENVRPLFESDDLTIVNLEGPLTTSKNKRSGRTFNFRGKPEYVNILSGSSVEICNVANNHALDFGEAGLSETAQVLSNAGIGVSGFSRTYSTTVKGVRICSLGFTKWQYSQKQMVKAVQAARETCDLLIVSMHWGEEGVYKTSSEQRSMGHALIDAGADLILGHHPHVFGGIEQYNGKYIVYSLGNFCFGGNSNPSDKRCLIFQQTFSVSPDGSIEDAGINIIPAAVTGSSSKNDFQPNNMPAERGETLLKNVAKYSDVSMSAIRWMNGSYMEKIGLTTLSATS